MKSSAVPPPSAAVPPGSTGAVSATGLANAAVWLCLGVAPLVWAGRLHPALELLSHQRMTLAAVLALSSALWAWQRRRVAVLLAVLALALGWPALASLLAHEPPLVGEGIPNHAGKQNEQLARLRVLQLNVHTQNPHKERVLALLRQTPADVLALEEVDAAWLAALAPLHAQYPHRFEVARPDNFGIALWSRLPLDATEVVDPGEVGVPTLLAQVQLSGQVVELVVTHPPPPMPPRGHLERDAQLAGLGARLARRSHPYVLAGDLNLTPWAPAFADLLAQTKLADPATQFWPTGTWPAALPLGRIWIDHVLAGNGARVTRRTVLGDVGSDHLPVLAEVVVGR